MAQATDTAFQIMASNCRFGSGITHEVGMDLVDLGAKRVMTVIARKAPGVPQVAEKEPEPFQHWPLAVSWISVSSAQMLGAEPGHAPGPPDIAQVTSEPAPGPKVGRSKALVMMKGRLKAG